MYNTGNGCLTNLFNSTSTEAANPASEQEKEEMRKVTKGVIWMLGVLLLPVVFWSTVEVNKAWGAGIVVIMDDTGSHKMGLVENGDAIACAEQIEPSAIIIKMVLVVEENASTKMYLRGQILTNNIVTNNSVGYQELHENCGVVLLFNEEEKKKLLSKIKKIGLPLVTDYSLVPPPTPAPAPDHQPTVPQKIFFN